MEGLLFFMSIAAVAGGLGMAAIGIGQSISGRRVATSASEVLLSEGPGYAEEIERPFSERLLGPAWGTFRRMGRTLTPTWQMKRMRRHAQLAGLGPGGVEGLLAIKAAAVAGGATLIPLAMAALGASFGPVVLWAIIGGAFGFFLPDLWIAKKGEARQNEIRRMLPETIDLMAIAVQAGMGLEGAIDLVARKLPGALGEELQRLLQEIQLGSSRRQALQKLRERTEISELSTFAMALIQADAIGSPVAEVLQTHAGEMRMLRRQRARETAAKLPVKLLFPLLLCIFPALMVIVIGPAIVSIVDAFTSGVIG
ncbi:MAG TPA: type II secretion system F family protein [Actinomycetota bacterium]|nr:type II secretion system F family protein [Actinomycetota bacterium]